jgi:hypothetical protein
MNRFAPLPSALSHAQSGADDWRVACDKVDLLMRGFKLAILLTLTGLAVGAKGSRRGR